MTKTIEEAAAEYAGEFVKKHNLYNPELLQVVVDTYKASAERMMSLPLAQRLTAEEKERVRKEYWQAARDWIDVGDARGCCKTCIALESIFGSDFFKKEGMIWRPRSARRTERRVGTTVLRVTAISNPTQNVSMAATLQ